MFRPHPSALSRRSEGVRKRCCKSISVLPVLTFKNKEIAANRKGRQFFNGNSMDLFDLNNNEYDAKPLADKMRPNNLDEFVGQVTSSRRGACSAAPSSWTGWAAASSGGRPAAAKRRSRTSLPPPRTGNFIKLNAVQSGVADVKKAVEDARTALKLYGKKTYLLLDECHRFNKTQSDSLLPAIEQGTILFIGSTTENPYASMTPQSSPAAASSSSGGSRTGKSRARSKRRSPRARGCTHTRRRWIKRRLRTSRR